MQDIYCFNWKLIFIVMKIGKLFTQGPKHQLFLLVISQPFSTIYPENFLIVSLFHEPCHALFLLSLESFHFDEFCYRFPSFRLLSITKWCHDFHFVAVSVALKSTLLKPSQNALMTDSITFQKTELVNQDEF